MHNQRSVGAIRFAMETWPPPGGFAERMFQRGTAFHASDLASEVDRLTTEHLDFFACVLAGHRISIGRDIYVEYMAWAVATEVLRFFLGDKWTNDNVFASHTDVARAQRG